MKKYYIDSLDNRDQGRLDAFLKWGVPLFEGYFRPVITGIERIPEGAGLYVANHNAGFLTPDTFTFAAAVYRHWGEKNLPYGLGHEVAIQWPIFHQLLVPLGAVRASHDNAHRLFKRGCKVLVYPGGDIDAFRSYKQRNDVVFGPRRGYLRLALREGVPIIPVVTAGAHEAFVVLTSGTRLAKLFRLNRLMRVKVFPIVFSIPWGLTLGPPPPYWPLPTRIFQEVLDPIHFDRQGEEAADDAEYVEACNEIVLGKMRESIRRLARKRKSAMRRAKK